MSLLALLAVLTNGVLSIPSSELRAITLGVSEAGTQVEVEFDVRNSARVEALLFTESEANRFHRGRSAVPVCRSGFVRESRMRCRVPERNHYVLVIDNRIEARAAATVHLRVGLQAPGNVVVQELPEHRRRLVIALSLAFFGSVVVFSARQYLKHN